MTGQTRMNTPARFDDVAALEEFMTRPSAPLIEDMTRVSGDIVVLGVGGKMGPTLARMAKRAAPGKRVIGVARFSAPLLRSQLESHGIECISADLLDRKQLDALPDCANVVFMAGRKFGATDDQPGTWAMNAPGTRVGRTALCPVAHRGVLDELRLSVRRRRRTWRSGGHADRPPAGRIRQFVRRSRTDVRVFLPGARHRWTADPFELRDRHALRCSA